MRLLLCFVVVAVMALAVYSSPVEEKYPPVEEAAAEGLFEVDGQGHENAGEREARHHRGGGGYGGYGGYGGFGGGHHGHHGGGYGGYYG